MKLNKSIGLFIIFCILAAFLLPGEQNDKNIKVLVITRARLIDGTGSAPLEDAVVVIREGKFAEIGPADMVKVPKEAEIIDVNGSTVVPGLIDAHVHITYPPNREETYVVNDSICSFRAAHFLKRHLMAGITTVRDVAAYHNVSIMAKKAFYEGILIGSRPIVVGEGITCTGGHGTERWKLAFEADGPDGFRGAVRAQIKAGADLIKILPPYSPAEIKAAIEETHAHEKFITIHSGIFKQQYDFVRWAVEEGADCIEHAYAIPDDVIHMMAKKGIYNVPTLSILAKLADEYEKKPGWEWKVKKYRESEAIFKKMKKAGVKMAVGTDAIFQYMNEYPEMYFEEIERFVHLGSTPMEAIVAATNVGAEVCDAIEKLGTIEKGKVADLLVINGDPLKQIENLRNIKIIIQNGVVIKR
jgi:imidazolonepropionase-like amidohydrolase